uniref:Uncharacterized protein n=1 Tax=Rhizophora mucronata TaxID=61149 RepID=A0A2P2NN22_RHIMU
MKLHFYCIVVITETCLLELSRDTFLHTVFISSLSRPICLWSLQSLLMFKCLVFNHEVVSESSPQAYSDLCIPFDFSWL